MKAKSASLTAQQLATVEAVANGPRNVRSPAPHIQYRQMTDLMRIILTVDKAIEEAALNHQRIGEAFYAIREWAGNGIDDIAARVGK